MIVIDANRHEMKADGKIVPLESKAFAIVKALKTARKTLSHEQILEKVYGYPECLEVNAQVVRVQVCRIRAAIRKIGYSKPVILTVPKHGYKIAL